MKVMTSQMSCDVSLSHHIADGTLFYWQRQFVANPL